MDLIAAHKGKIVAVLVVALIVAVVVVGRGNTPSKATVDRAADTASADLVANRAAAGGAAAEALLRSASAAMESLLAERQTLDGAVAALPGIEPNIQWMSGGVADASRNQVAVTVTGPFAYSLSSAVPGGPAYLYTRDPAGAVTRSCGPGCSW